MKQGQGNSRLDLENLLHRGFRYALSLTHDEVLAEDLVQDACVKLIGKEKLWHRGYFFTTIRNRYVDMVRRSKKLVIYSMDEEQENDRVPYLAVVTDSEANLSNADALEKALAQLRTSEREAFFLSAVEGYTAKEISRLTQTPRNTVLSHIHRARRKLAAMLGDTALSEVSL